MSDDHPGLEEQQPIMCSKVAWFQPGPHLEVKVGCGMPMKSHPGVDHCAKVRDERGPGQFIMYIWPNKEEADAETSTG